MQSVLEQPKKEIQITKKCPFCAELIQDEAIKCRYCGEFLTEKPKTKTKWYQSTATIIVAFICLGPLALPLVWTNPRYNPVVKLIVTAVMVTVTVLLCYAMADMYKNVMQQIQSLGM